MAKEKSWTQYGERLYERCKTSPREFYKSVKTMRMRDEPFDPATTINDANGKVLHEEEEIVKRWESYFKELLNPVGVLIQDTQALFTPNYQDHTEPNILESEVRKNCDDQSQRKGSWRRQHNRSHPSMWRDWYPMAHHHFSESLEGKKSTGGLAKRNCGANMGKEREQKRLQYTTKSCRENVCKDSRAA